MTKFDKLNICEQQAVEKKVESADYNELREGYKEYLAREEINNRPMEPLGAILVVLVFFLVLGSLFFLGARDMQYEFFIRNTAPSLCKAVNSTYTGIEFSYFLQKPTVFCSGVTIK